MNTALVLAAATALLLCGCATPSLQPQASSGALSTAAAGTQGANVTVSVNGTTPYRVCVPDGIGSCTGGKLPGAKGETFVPAGVNGSPLAASLVLTWTPPFDSGEPLTLAIVALTSCGEGCSSAQTLASRIGPPPLKLDVKEIKWPDKPDAKLAWGVYQPCSPGPLYMCAGHELDYHLEGNLTVRA